MPNAIDPAASSLEALGTQYEAITHNLANANTVGFKRRLTVFQQALQASMAPAGTPGATAATTTQTGVGSLGLIDFSQGAAVATGRPLDLALSGKGFFVLETAAGEQYTRKGVFALNKQNQIVDTSGRLLAGEGGPIVVPPTVAMDKIQISGDGTVWAAGANIGKIKLVEFPDPQVLKPAGDNCFRIAPGTKSDAAKGTTVQQGYQESSNISVVQELVDLIMVSRLYEANSKFVQAQSDKSKELLQVAMS